MKIAVAGCGALGSFYGAKLCRAGHDVHFLLRSDYEVVRAQGVHIRSRQGDVHVRPRCVRNPGEIGPAELLLIGLKTTANDQFSRLLPPLIDPSTAILTLQNGLGNEELLARLFPAEQILGGLCFVCLNRTGPGVIEHIDHGRVVLGEFGRLPGPRTWKIAESFQQSGVLCEVTDNLACSHWEKLVWNIPFNGLGVASAAGIEALTGDAVWARKKSGLKDYTAQGSSSFLDGCLTTDKLLAHPQWERLVRELMAEVIAAANGLGLGVAGAVAEENIQRTRTMGAYKASTLIDFERGQPLELEALFREPLRQAQRAGVAAPRLARLCEVLENLNPQQNR